MPRIYPLLFCSPAFGRALEGCPLRANADDSAWHHRQALLRGPGWRPRLLTVRWWRDTVCNPVWTVLLPLLLLPSPLLLFLLLLILLLPLTLRLLPLW
jgi:hypothetical protein